MIQARSYDLLLLNLQMTVVNSFDILKRIQTISPGAPVIATSSTEEASLIVRAVKAGVFDVLVKPFSSQKLCLVMQRSLENRNLKDEINYLRHEQDIIYDFGGIIAESLAMKQLIATLQKFSQTDATILVTGETGTGKSFLSGAVHFNSRRKDYPFVTINCANIPETLLESELFGHEKGAFTGAAKTRVGRLEQARDGTVFLDEIGEMNASLQAKLLGVLENKSFERVGGNKTIHSDVRIIAATNRDLEAQVASGRFREDLYYRINVLRVHMPPLRDRRQCIQPLAEHLLTKTCRNLKKSIRGFSPEAIELLANYHWPGNIRQLANTIERAAILEDFDRISPDNIVLPEIALKTAPQTQPAAADARPSPIVPLNRQEKDSIVAALEKCLWIQKDAAALLGITPRSLNYKIKRMGITHPRWRKNR